MPRTYKSWEEIQESLGKYDTDGDFAALELAQVEEMMVMECLNCPKEETLRQRAKYFEKCKFLDLEQMLMLAERGGSMLDDIIGGFGASQIYWGGVDSARGTTTTLPLNSQYSAIRLGQDGSIFATLAINLVILVVAIEEAIRTRNWKDLPLLNYLTLTSMVVASSSGGPGSRMLARTSTGRERFGKVRVEAKKRVRLGSG